MTTVMFDYNYLFETITRLINKYNQNHDSSLVEKVINDIKTGMSPDMDLKSYLEYISNVCATYIYIEPEFSKVATYFVIKKLNK